MKRSLLFYLFLSFFVANVYSQKQKEEGLLLKQTMFDFGTIPQGKPVTHGFEVVNTTQKPLYLVNVEVSCGCTTPEWTKAPIAPGASSVIKVGFNAAAEGEFVKNITIVYNQDQKTTLSIKGNVYPAPATSAPLNTSLFVVL